VSATPLSQPGNAEGSTFRKDIIRNCDIFWWI